MHNDDLITPASAGPAIRTVEIRRGAEWLVHGFQAFLRHPLGLTLGGLGLVLAIWLLGEVGASWIGSALIALFGIVAVGVLMAGYQALERAQDPRAAMRAAAGLPPLWMLGLMSGAAALAVSAVGGVLGVRALVGGTLATETSAGMVGIYLVIVFAVSIGLAMALWLAPALVVFKGVKPIAALRYSLSASVRNIVPYIIFTLLAMVACILGALALGLGLIVVFPVLICGTTTAFQDIFADVGAQEGMAYLDDE